MAEKLKTPKSINWDDTPEAMLQRHYIITDVYEKINELVDAVNELQAQVAILQEHAHPTAKTESTETPTISKMENVSFGTGRRIDISYINDIDYAEQKKWIGKLCRFWDDSDEPENCVYDVLYCIFDQHHEDCPFQCGNGEWYEYCEPVKPDDDIIFKGE